MFGDVMLLLVRVRTVQRQVQSHADAARAVRDVDTRPPADELRRRRLDREHRVRLRS